MENVCIVHFILIGWGLKNVKRNTPIFVSVSKEIEAAKIYWKTQNITNLRRNGWNQSVPDDPTGVGIVNGLYKCLQRDYCHDFRPFQLFNFEGSAHILAGNVFLVAGGLILGLLINLEV